MLRAQDERGVTVSISTDQYCGNSTIAEIRRPAAAYYDPSSGRGHLLAAAADGYVSPELGTDLVVNRLDHIDPDSDCRGPRHAGLDPRRRMAVVDHIIQMWAATQTLQPLSYNQGEPIE